MEEGRGGGVRGAPGLLVVFIFFSCLPSIVSVRWFQARGREGRAGPLCLLLLRRTIVNRTYGTHKTLPGIYLPIFTSNIWSYLPWSPAIVFSPIYHPTDRLNIQKLLTSRPFFDRVLSTVGLTAVWNSTLLARAMWNTASNRVYGIQQV